MNKEEIKNKSNPFDTVICTCGSVEHQFIFIYEYDKKYMDGEVYMHIHLNKERSFFKRIIHAIKYIFGYRCRFGDFDEVVLDKRHIGKFKRLIKYLEKT